jgi:hypothetical protein
MPAFSDQRMMDRALSLREALQDIENALLKAGYDDITVVTERGSFHWMTCRASQRARGRVMKRSPSLVPDQPIGAGAVYMVLDDFGKLGRAWREMDEEKTSENDVIHDIISGEYSRPVKVIAFDLEERWVRDVTEDIARGVLTKVAREGLTLSATAAEFVSRATGADVQDALSGA